MPLGIFRNKKEEEEKERLTSELVKALNLSQKTIDVSQKTSEECQKSLKESIDIIRYYKGELDTLKEWRKGEKYLAMQLRKMYPERVYPKITGDPNQKFNIEDWTKFDVNKDISIMKDVYQEFLSYFTGELDNVIELFDSDYDDFLRKERDEADSAKKMDYGAKRALAEKYKNQFESIKNLLDKQTTWKSKEGEYNFGGKKRKTRIKKNKKAYKTLKNIV
jgi:hypothetical protein